MQGLNIGRQSPIDNPRCVFLITSKDGGVLFDLDKDEFLKLDPVASHMWTLLSAGKSKMEAATIVSTLCGVDRERVYADLEGFLDAAAQRGITPECVRISEPPQPPSGDHPNYPYYGQDLDQPRPRPSFFSVWKAFFALSLFDMTLSFGSLKTLCRRVKGWPPNPRRKVDADLIGTICTAVERACVWYPKKAVCLQRSAVTACLLKSVGVDACMVVGARVMPMVSHAWVEVDGAVVNDHLKVRTVYQRLAAF
jgi:Transglutaminase-like superfamily/Coenzyme PQQ synthesis protein D (PqqD)